jgi:hypothetical protein
MIGPVFENGMASRTQSVCRKHSALGPKKTWPRIGFGFKHPIENGIVGLNGSKIAVGTIDEVGVSCWQDDGCAAWTCSSFVRSPVRKAGGYSRKKSIRIIRIIELYVGV